MSLLVSSEKGQKEKVEGFQQVLGAGMPGMMGNLAVAGLLTKGLGGGDGGC